MATKIYRQGDVLLVRHDNTPESGMLIERDNERVVLAYGEVTGHSHAVRQADVQLYERDSIRWLIAPEEFVIEHEEHHALTVPAGIWVVVAQYEYEPGAVRRVMD